MNRRDPRTNQPGLSFRCLGGGCRLYFLQGGYHFCGELVKESFESKRLLDGYTALSIASISQWEIDLKHALQFH
jgi:hypothetical protein